MKIQRGRKLRLEPTYQRNYLKAKQEIANAKKMEEMYREQLVNVDAFSREYWAITKNLGRIVSDRITSENRLKQEEATLEAMKADGDRLRKMELEDGLGVREYDVTKEGKGHFYGVVRTVCLEHSRPGKPTRTSIMRDEEGDTVVCAECATFESPVSSLYLESGVFILCRAHCPDGGALEAFVRPDGAAVLVLCPECIEDGKATREKLGLEVDPEDHTQVRQVR